MVTRRRPAEPGIDSGAGETRPNARRAVFGAFTMQRPVDPFAAMQMSLLGGTFSSSRELYLCVA